MSSPVILLEFNELTPALIDRFIARRELPNFDRLKRESLTYTTKASGPPSHLSPWIQWVTVHTGLAFDEHQIFRLDEGHKLAAPRIWDLVPGASWVCGSMNAKCAAGTKAHVVPDPWCTQVAPQPLELAPYFRFVQQNVQEHTADRESLAPADYLKFMAWMMSHGLSATTVGTIVAQLAEERVNKSRWKRVALLDLLQFDVFVHYYKKVRPLFSTFFLNSTAHYQHAYWNELDSGGTGRHKGNGRNAILFGYKRMDALIGRFLSLLGDGGTLILCTALSQQGNPAATRSFYRPKSFERFAEFAQLGSRYALSPVMTQQFHVEFATPAELEEGERRIAAVMLGGKPVMRTKKEGLRLFVSCGLRSDVSPSAEVTNGDMTIPFADLFHKVPTKKHAEHHPDGVFWIRTPERRHVSTEGTVPLTSVAPTILSLMGINPPAHMREPSVLPSGRAAVVA